MSLWLKVYFYLVSFYAMKPILALISYLRMLETLDSLLYKIIMYVKMYKEPSSIPTQILVVLCLLLLLLYYLILSKFKRMIHWAMMTKRIFCILTLMFCMLNKKIVNSFFLPLFFHNKKELTIF